MSRLFSNLLEWSRMIHAFSANVISLFNTPLNSLIPNNEAYTAIINALGNGIASTTLFEFCFYGGVVFYLGWILASWLIDILP